jgi:hypothetical protein
MAEYFLAVFKFFASDIVAEVLICPFHLKAEIRVLLSQGCNDWIRIAPCGLEFDMLAIKFLWGILGIIAIAVPLGSPISN